MREDHHPTQWNRLSSVFRVFSTSLVLTFAASVVFGCAEIEKTTPEAAEELATLRADLEYVNVLVAYQKKRKLEARAAGQNPDKFDRAGRLAEEERFKELWKKQREIEIDKFEARYLDLSADVVAKCRILAGREGTEAYAFDKCVDRIPVAQYDPLKTGVVAIAIALLFLIAMLLYRSGRRRMDSVALASASLGLKSKQGARSTVLTGTYKGYELRIESSAPEVGGGDKFIRVAVESGMDPDLVVRFGPLAPPTGLAMPDLEAPEVADSRIPVGYKLRLSEGSSAEVLLSGDVGFQIREFDPVDVRVHDGMCVTTTWFLVSEPAQVVEFVDLCLAVADVYKAA